MTQAAVAANYFEGGKNLTRGASEDDHDLATIVNNLVADIATKSGTTALASTTPGSEGAKLIGTDAKPNLGGATTVEAALTALNTADSPSAAELASIVGGSEGASLVGTDAKASLGAATTVEGCLTNLDTKNPPARSSGAVTPVGAVAGAIGDIYVDTVTDIAYINTDGTVNGWVVLGSAALVYDPGAVAAVVVTQAGVPLAGQLFTVGGVDVYEADGAGANINFAIGAAEATMDNLIAAINASATLNYNAVKLSATQFALFSAATPHGVAIAGAPAIAVLDALDNYEVSAVNLNAAGGRVAGVSIRSTRVVDVGAADVTAAGIAFMFPFNVTRFQWHVRTALGAQKYVTETFVVPATALNTVLVSIGTGATPILATDIVTVEAWS